MSSVSAGRVSAGGRRASTGPAGSGTVRKKTRCNPDSTARCCTHSPSSAWRVSTQSATAMRVSLRQYFKRHLPGSDIVRDIFRGHVEAIFAGGQRRGNYKLAGIGAGLLVPTQKNGRGTVK